MKRYHGTRTGAHDTTLVEIVQGCERCGRETTDGDRCRDCAYDETIGSTPLPIRTQAGAAYPKSPSGHAWGYGGSGPSQMAMDILWDHFGKEPHPRCFQAFKRRFLESHEEPTIDITTQDIDAWLTAEYDGPKALPTRGVAPPVWTPDEWAQAAARGEDYAADARRLGAHLRREHGAT